tara:strand:- start:3 stop:623 length:621 start_codon:yes stop_codon:yes gene_type:complete
MLTTVHLQRELESLLCLEKLAQKKVIEILNNATKANKEYHFLRNQVREAEEKMYTARKLFDAAMDKFIEIRDGLVQFLNENNVPWKVTKCIIHLWDIWKKNEFLAQNPVLAEELDSKFGKFKSCLKARKAYQEARDEYNLLKEPSYIWKERIVSLNALHKKLTSAKTTVANLTSQRLEKERKIAEPTRIEKYGRGDKDVQLSCSDL